jgi:hypothetical protein
MDCKFPFQIPNDFNYDLGVRIAKTHLLCSHNDHRPRCAQFFNTVIARVQFLIFLVLDYSTTIGNVVASVYDLADDQF